MVAVAESYRRISVHCIPSHQQKNYALKKVDMH
jgi:hypothetical protein